MHLYTFANERHVLATEEEVGTEATVAVWVCLNPSVEGAARRGRPPGTAIYENGPRTLKVTSSQVVKMEDPSDKLVELGTKYLQEVSDWENKDNEKAA